MANMTTSYRNTLIFRWSIASATAIALFWFVWYLVNGSVPTISEIEFTETCSIHLPFAMSMWWDVLIGPLGSIVTIFLTTTVNKDSEALFVCLGSGLTASLVIGIIVGLTISLSFGLTFSLVASLVVGLLFGLGSLWRWLVPKDALVKDSKKHSEGSDN